jgi:ubiquinone/menaquinone biosynthesis C-methylase UbiE
MSQHPTFTNPPELPESNKETYLRFMIIEEICRYVHLSMSGKLYPDRIPVNTMERVLQLGCGTGDWLFDLAKQHPQLHIYGIEQDENVLQKAKARRNLGNQPQIELRLMDLTAPLPIPDNYIDLIHIRSGALWLPPALWPALLQETARILKPGGWLFILEGDYFEVSSSAFMQLHYAMIKAMMHMDRTMDHSGVTFGVGLRVPRMLMQAGFEEVAYDLNILDAGFMGGMAGRIYRAQIMNFISHAKPLVVQSGALSATAFDALMEQQQQELQDPDVCGWEMLISAYGRKSSD